jgi:hypothetical protein
MGGSGFDHGMTLDVTLSEAKGAMAAFGPFTSFRVTMQAAR